MFSLELGGTIVFHIYMSKLENLPKTKDVKDKIRKTFHLSTEAAGTYEKCKLIGINSTEHVSNKIEAALLEIKPEVDAKYDELMRKSKKSS